ncbi:peptidoglycan-binding protein [Elioraea sp.]|uniref:peptidoglycan-binding protein n=1 Tax=Elioraea sp. TaxID=2185103 RepID=UPI003F71EEE7
MGQIQPEWNSGDLNIESNVVLIQIALRAYGHLKASVDGRVGPSTRRAARDFRRFRSLDGDDEIDVSLLEALYKSPDFYQPMRYTEGSTLLCFRWGISNVLLYVTNIGTITCTIKGSLPTNVHLISQGHKFCEESIRFKSIPIRCTMIFDGQKFVDLNRLISMVNAPSPDVPALVDTFDARTRRITTIEAILRSEPALFDFSGSVHIGIPPKQTESPVPITILRLNGRSLCHGTSQHVEENTFRFLLNCFDNLYTFSGESRLVGFVDGPGQLLPVYEGTVSHMGSWARLRPPQHFFPLSIR